MNLKEIQTTKATDEAVIISLKNGKYPTYMKINEYIKNKFKNLIIGMPTFRPLFGKKYECSNPKEYNYMVDKIHSDLTDLYDADNSSNNEILSMFSYYDSEKNKIEAMINKIHNRLDIILNKSNKDNTKTSVFDNFDDFSKIDFLGSEKVLQETTSFVDLTTKSVSNNTLCNSVKIPLVDVKHDLKVFSNVINNELIEPISNCLKDTKNEVWLQKITSATNDGIAIRLLIELPYEKEINLIEYQLQSPREATIKLSIANNNKEIREFNEVTTNNIAEWNIKTSKAKVIIFDITKLEPDGVADLNYEYYIGAKNISIYKNIYENKSILISKPFEILEPFNNVYLDVQETLPPDTAIRYFIGIDYNDGKQISWSKVNNKKLNNLRLLNGAKLNISEHFGNNYGNKFEDKAFVLATLDKPPVKNGCQVFLGNNMWERRTIVINDTEDVNLKNLLNDGKLEYVKMNKIEFEQAKNTASIYTTNVYCELPSIVKSNVCHSSKTSLSSLFVNGTKIETVDNKKNIRLSVGWNKIQIISLSKEEDSTLTLDAYFGDVSNSIRAVRDAITEIDYYDLVNNLHSKSFNCYSIVDNNIVVNYDPKEINLEAVIEFMYKKNESDFDNMDMYFMAILNNFSDDVTPKIHNYKIVTS